MDYFGWIVEDLQDIWTDVYQSPHALEAKALLKIIDKAIFEAASLERAHAAAADRPSMGAPRAKPSSVVALPTPVRAIASAARFAAE
jgi:hypothetical protein